MKARLREECNFIADSQVRKADPVPALWISTSFTIGFFRKSGDRVRLPDLRFSDMG